MRGSIVGGRPSLDDTISSSDVCHDPTFSTPSSHFVATAYVFKRHHMTCGLVWHKSSGNTPTRKL